MSRTTEYRALMAGISLVCTLGALASVIPVVDHVLNLAAAVLVAAGLLWLAVGALRRELRIRRHLGAIKPLARPAAAVHPMPGRRLPAGAHAVAPLDRSHRFARPLSNPAATAAPRTGGAR